LDGNTAETSGMRLIPKQTFFMGSNSPLVFYADEEGPAREVSVDSFWIDETSVTNSAFAKFVAETGYVTEAETFGWSFVFDGLVSADVLENHTRGRLQQPNWWLAVNGADWKHPFGPGSDAIADHPVVHISWNDAVAYANWSGKRLPTEAEWECAARGGLEQKTYPWGDDFEIQGKPGANIWQGDFPNHNTLEDGYLATAPARSFSANGYGLYNLVGNVWEWTQSDWQGGKVLKGGSYLCHDSYCNRYRNSARIKNSPDSSLSHTGFRLVRGA
jgi:formylglycine-generating enzyme required for sulfatase activity